MKQTMILVLSLVTYCTFSISKPIKEHEALLHSADQLQTIDGVGNSTIITEEDDGTIEGSTDMLSKLPPGVLKSISNDFLLTLPYKSTGLSATNTQIRSTLNANPTVAKKEKKSEYTTLYYDTIESRFYIDAETSQRPMCHYQSPIFARQYPFIGVFAVQRVMYGILFLFETEILRCELSPVIENANYYQRKDKKAREKNLVANANIDEGVHKIKLLKSPGGITKCSINTKYKRMLFQSHWRECEDLIIPASENLMTTVWKFTRYVVWNPDLNEGAILHRLQQETPVWTLLPSMVGVKAIYGDTLFNLRISVLNDNTPEEYLLGGWSDTDGCNNCKWEIVLEDDEKLYKMPHRIPFEIFPRSILPIFWDTKTDWEHIIRRENQRLQNNSDNV